MLKSKRVLVIVIAIVVIVCCLAACLSIVIFDDEVAGAIDKFTDESEEILEGFEQSIESGAGSVENTLGNLTLTLEADMGTVYPPTVEP